MNIYEFVDMYKEAKPENTFFDDDWLDFLGESLDRMVVLDNTHTIHDDYDDSLHECYLIYSHVEGFDEVRDVLHAFDVDTLNYIPIRHWTSRRVEEI